MSAHGVWDHPPISPQETPSAQNQPSWGTGNWADSDKWLLDSFSAAQGTLQSRARRENNSNQPPQNSFNGLMQMDRGWREAKRGTTCDTDNEKKKKKKIPSTLPAAVWCSNTQTPFSPREMTFWDVEKLSADKSGCDRLIGLAEVMETLHLVQKMCSI